MNQGDQNDGVNMIYGTSITVPRACYAVQSKTTKSKYSLSVLRLHLFLNDFFAQ